MLFHLVASHRHPIQLLTKMSKAVLLWLLTAIALSACSKGADQPDDQATAQLSGYTHTADYIHQFLVDDAWGGNVFAYGDGGKLVCCIVYPPTWREGLTAKVLWITSSSDPNATGAAAEGQWREVTVPVERYKEPGTRLNVHFLEGGKVRLIITNGTDEALGYLGPRLPAKPKDFKW